MKTIDELIEELKVNHKELRKMNLTTITVTPRKEKS